MRIITVFVAIGLFWVYSRHEAANPLALVYLNNMPVSVELAQTNQSRSRGLMFRSRLASDSGMLFIYDAPEKLRFWMKNTPLDLDIGFFSADGRLLHIERMSAFDEKTVHVAKSPAKYALEMNRGWFTENNIEPGAQLRFESNGP